MILLVPLVSARQTDTREFDLRGEARRCLASEEALEQARGAWIVGAHHLVDEVPLLLGTLVEQASRGAAADGAERRLRIGLLDALIETRGALPVELAEEAWALDPLLTLILVSRDPGRHVVFLETLLDERLDDFQWVAVRNLLFQEKSTRLAPSILCGRVERIVIEVHEPEAERVRVGGCGGFGLRSRSSYMYPSFDGLPTVIHRASFSARPGSVVLAPGQRPVYYTRQVFPAGGPAARGGGSCGTGLDRARLGLDYLRGMAPLRLTTFLGGRIVATTWEGWAAHRAEVRRIRNEFQVQRDEFLRHLSSQRWLDRERDTRDDSRLEFELVDLRHDRTVALPPFATD